MKNYLRTQITLYEEDKNYPIWRRQERRSKHAVQLASWQLRSNQILRRCPSVCPSIGLLTTFSGFCTFADKSLGRNGIELEMQMFPDDLPLASIDADGYCCHFMRSSVRPTIHGLGFVYCIQSAWKKWPTIWHAYVSRWLTLSIHGCLSGLGSIHFFQFNSIPIQAGFGIFQFNSIPIQIGFRIFQFNSNSIHFLSVPIQFKFYAP